MPYTAEISRSHPCALLFLLDQSASMADPFGSAGDAREADPEPAKAEVLAQVINRTLQDVVLRCAKEEGVRDYFHIGLIGYGESVRSLLEDAEQVDHEAAFVPVSTLANRPLRLDRRTRRSPDGTGVWVERTIHVPIWIEPFARNGTPMCRALEMGTAMVRKWIDRHPDSYPPIVMNITDGESTDGDPTPHAARLRDDGTTDGEVLLFTIHLSSTPARPVAFPDSVSALPDAYARLLYHVSSPLPAPMRAAARQEGFNVGPDARGFLFNADPASLIRFLEIGTRPANLR